MDTKHPKGSNCIPANNDARLPDIVHHALAQVTQLQMLRGIGQLFRWAYAWKYGIDDPTQATADFGAFEAGIHPLPDYISEYCEHLLDIEYPKQKVTPAIKGESTHNLRILPARPGAKIVRLDTGKKRK